jgi:hypothetical protein
MAAPSGCRPITILQQIGEPDATPRYIARSRHGPRRTNSFIKQVGNRTTRDAVAGSNNRMLEFATVQLHATKARILIDATRLIIHRDLRDTS